MRKFGRLAAVVALASALILGFAACTPTTGGGDTTTGVSGTISTNTTWATDTYVSGSIAVAEGVTLTISPGTTVTFASDQYLWVSAGGTFSAVGTAAKPIVFKGATSSTWRGIYFDDLAIANTMTYCTVTGAGASSYFAVTVDASAKASITNCTIYGNAAGGIYAATAASGTTITGNRFYSNTSYPLHVNSNVSFDKTNLFAASGATVDLTDLKNAVFFYGDIGRSIIFDITEVPYLFDGSSAIPSGSTLTINPGVALHFLSDQYLWISAGGVLTAKGTSAAGISFAPLSSAVSWRGIHFDDNAINSELSYCSVKGAGSSSYYAITEDSGVKATVDYCTIDGNTSGGIDAYAAAAGNLITNTTFGANGDTVASIYDIVYDHLNTIMTGSTWDTADYY